MSVRGHSHWTITEARAEQMADRRVQGRLATDHAYLHAPDAETQQQREEEIASDVWLDITSEYEIV